MNKAIIIGAGINGLATAWGLVKRGWKVEMLDQGPVPNPLAASWDVHKLIRTHYAGFPAYAARIPAAFAAWEALWSDLGARHYVERGIMALSREGDDWTDRARTALRQAGSPHDVIDSAETARRYPMLETDGVNWALVTRGGGVLLADRIILGLVDYLRRNGAMIREHCPAIGLERSSGTVLTGQGPVQADVVVVAAGIGALTLLPDMTERFRPVRVCVLHMDPAPQWRDAWAKAPCWVDLGGDSELWGMAPVGALPMKLGNGHHSFSSDPAHGRDLVAGDIDAIREAYRGRFRDFDQFDLRKAEVNFYLQAPDERFVLRRDGRMVFLSADSGHGFKFGALTGVDVAGALDGGDFDTVARRLAGY